VKKIKYLCQCCGEDFIVEEKVEENEEVICPECGEGCYGNCREVEVIDEWLEGNYQVIWKRADAWNYKVIEYGIAAGEVGFYQVCSPVMIILLLW